MTTNGKAATERHTPVAFPKIVAAQVSCTGDTWVLVPDDDGGTVAVVDDIGHRVWELCDGTRTPDEITDALSRTLGYPAAGVVEFVEELHRLRLVTSKDWPGQDVETPSSATESGSFYSGLSNCRSTTAFRNASHSSGV
ncbi:PqqD family protein [Nocardia wallacei]